jgi:hypothetical protein
MTVTGQHDFQIGQRDDVGKNIILERHRVFDFTDHFEYALKGGNMGGILVDRTASKKFDEEFKKKERNNNNNIESKSKNESSEPEKGKTEARVERTEETKHSDTDKFTDNKFNNSDDPEKFQNEEANHSDDSSELLFSSAPPSHSRRHRQQDQKDQEYRDKVFGNKKTVKVMLTKWLRERVTRCGPIVRLDTNKCQNDLNGRNYNNDRNTVTNTVRNNMMRSIIRENEIEHERIIHHLEGYRHEPLSLTEDLVGLDVVFDQIIADKAGDEAGCDEAGCDQGREGGGKEGDGEGEGNININIKNEGEISSSPQIHTSVENVDREKATTAKQKTDQKISEHKKAPKNLEEYYQDSIHTIIRKYAVPRPPTQSESFDYYNSVLTTMQKSPYANLHDSFTRLVRGRKGFVCGKRTCGFLMKHPTHLVKTATKLAAGIASECSWQSWQIGIRKKLRKLVFQVFRYFLLSI